MNNIYQKYKEVKSNMHNEDVVGCIFRVSTSLGPYLFAGPSSSTEWVQDYGRVGMSLKLAKDTLLLCVDISVDIDSFLNDTVWIQVLEPDHNVVGYEVVM